MKINKFYSKRITALICVCGITLSLVRESNAEAMFSSSYLDTDSINVTIDVNDVKGKISPYIYGINAESDISMLKVNAIKQTDPRISSYNWENNFSNSGTGTASTNDAELINSYPPGKWGEPALYTEYLITKAKRYNVPSRYVTLQMMGKVAADNEDDIFSTGGSGRWNDIYFSKADSYLSEPNITDVSVYIDEYVSYLVNRYGYAVDGGINGYFLDNEPENWAERFPSVISGKVTADELVEKSSKLASAVKKIDPTALVYGPSISGIEAYTNLKNNVDWESHNREYSWFIDYYLMKMNEVSRLSGTRLLDVLDVHYHTEATNGLFEQVIDGTDAFSNNTRMQAPRIFWDSTYTENSTIAILHTQHLPLIPTLEASINMYYPGTKLSFSEYNFGGGDHISGGIATADTLGIFAEFGVHMACLKPNTENIDYHKAAINIYTDYDGMGSSFGDTFIDSDNGGDIMSSVYSSIDSGDITTVKTVLINKNQTSKKKVTLDIEADIDYEAAEVYCFSNGASEIARMADDIVVTDNKAEFEMEPLSVCMLVFRSSMAELEDNPPDDELIEELPEDEPEVTSVSKVTEKQTSKVSSETLAPEHVSAETLSTVITTVNPDEMILPEESNPQETEVTRLSEASETTMETSGRKPAFDDDFKVHNGFKVFVCIMLGGVVVAMLYVLFATGKKK